MFKYVATNNASFVFTGIAGISLLWILWKTIRGIRGKTGKLAGNDGGKGLNKHSYSHKYYSPRLGPLARTQQHLTAYRKR